MQKINRSINQINSRIENNPTIRLYKEVSADRDNWRNRNFMFSYDKEIGRTITGNFIFGQALKEFHAAKDGIFKTRRFSYSETNRNHYFEIESLFTGRKLQFDCKLSFSIFTGYIAIEIESNFNPIGRFSIHKVRSNRTFENLDIEKYVRESILPEYLYPAGVFRELQVFYNQDKKQALEKYKEYRFNQKNKEEFIDTEKAWRNRLKKDKNIEPGYDFFTEEEMRKAYHSFNRQDKRKKLFKMPSPSSMLDAMDFEDDIDSLEFAYSNYISNEYPDNAVFI